MKHEYSDDMHRKRIAILGPLPPPLGGVSVHVERVILKLKKQNNSVHHFNTTSELRYRFFLLYCMHLFLFLLFRWPRIVIYNTTYLSNALTELRVLLWFKKIFFFKLQLVEHDCRFVYTLSLVQKQKYRAILSAVDKQIFIGPRTQLCFMEMGLWGTHKHSLEDAFLPPDVDNESLLLEKYPEELFMFMHDHTPLLLANAFQLSYLNGKDLYGFDQLIEAFILYKKDAPKAGLILILAQRGDEQLFDAMINQINKHDLQRDIYIIVGHYVLWPLFKHAHIFVRPTLSDGASVSIQEALHFGIPVVASDACWRPAECIIYRTGDNHALYETILNARFLENPVPHIIDTIDQSP